MSMSKSKFTVTLCASLVKFQFWNETLRARTKAFVLYDSKQNSVERISKIHARMGSIHLLLRIISRICKKSGIYLALDTIGTFDHHSVFICMNKICVQQEFPNPMHKLSSTMCHEILFLSAPFTAERSSKVLK